MRVTQITHEILIFEKFRNDRNEIGEFENQAINYLVEKDRYYKYRYQENFSAKRLT